MKKFTYIFAIGLLSLLGLVSCVESQEFYNSGISSAMQLVSPDDNSEIALSQSEALKVTFEWNTSDAADGAVKYRLAFFASASGPEIYSITPSVFNVANARLTTLSVTHTQLNEIASLAGIEPGSKGSVYWSVVMVKGYIESASAVRNLTLARYQALDDVPYAIFMTGAATEGGTAMANAIKMDNKGNGKFQAISSLVGGSSFYVTNSNVSGDIGARRFGATADGVLVEGSSNSISVPAGATYPYRITVDFANALITLEPIEKVEALTYTSTGAPYYIRTELPYVSNGVWSGKVNVPTTYSGRPRFYKFCATIGGKQYIWGTNSTGNGAAPSILTGGSWTIYERAAADPFAENTQYTYRFMSTLPGVAVTMTLYFSPGLSETYHEMSVEGASAPAVESLLTPAADQTIQLSTSGNTTFQWSAVTKPEGSVTPQYEVVLYSDAAATNELGRTGKTTSSQTSFSLATLENYAEQAGIAAHQAGNLYWKVNTIVWTQEQLSATTGVLRVRRILPLPTAMYLFGPGTEYGTDKSGAAKLSQMEDVTGSNVVAQLNGQYEIITYIKAGETVYLAEGNTPDSRLYTINASLGVAESTSGFSLLSDGIYRIRVNLNTMTATYDKILKVEFYTTGGSPSTLNMTYAGKGTWKALNVNPNFGGDDRVYFRMYLSDFSWIKVGNRKSDYGSAPSASTDPTTLKGNSEYYANYTKEQDQWGWSWKIWASARGKSPALAADILLNMNPESEHYSFYITFEGQPDFNTNLE